MKKFSFITSLFAGLALTAATAHAAEEGSMEKCTVVDANGNGLIKEHMGDCASATSSCSGTNKAGDPNSWILVPTGDCAKINAGDYTDISQSVIDKIDTSPAPETGTM